MADNQSKFLDSVVQSVTDGLNESCWRPKADIYRTDKGWLIKFDMAGVQDNDIDILVSGRKLMVRGSRRDYLAEQKGLRHHRLEINYSQFQRTIELPHDIESSQISHEMMDGMLIIHID